MGPILSKLSLEVRSNVLYNDFVSLYFSLVSNNINRNLYQTASPNLHFSR
jgi:hypothetical protein